MKSIQEIQLDRPAPNPNCLSSISERFTKLSSVFGESLIDYETVLETHCKSPRAITMLSPISWWLYVAPTGP